MKTALQAYRIRGLVCHPVPPAGGAQKRSGPSTSYTAGVGNPPVQPPLFPVIVGPTAGGKSALAVELALAVGKAEIVTADSIQVYRGLDIGSAKPTTDERRGVPHHLIDVVEPTEPFSVHQWLGLAERTIDQIRARGALPVVVGGTHLYIKALLDGLFEGPEVDPRLREELRATDQRVLREELERVDPAAAVRIHAADHRRTVRAVEVYRQTGTPISDLQKQWDQEGHRRTDCVLVGLDWPAEAINPRINTRVKDMFEQGLADEARRLFDAGRFGPQAREALGYKQLIGHFAGRCTLGEAAEKIKVQTRRFAKNQRTWLNRLRSTPGSVWIDAAGVPSGEWPGAVWHACLIGRQRQWTFRR